MAKKLDKVPLRGATLARKDILNAAKQFTHAEGWKELNSQKFVLVIGGKEYPPKKIASAASGLPVSGFSGGAELNDKLRRLGFEISSK